jgi:hypothetical protein
MIYVLLQTLWDNFGPNNLRGSQGKEFLGQKERENIRANNKNFNLRFLLFT